MYSVSNAFKEKMRSPIQEHRVTGTIGSLSFSEANIVEGSFSISNQSTDSNDVVLGSCYVGQLNAEFTGININYGDWINKVITPTFALNLGDSWESVPLGVFTVKEAKHTEHGVQVTAYDNMIKFDKKFKKSHFQSLSGLYNIISQICTDAGVTLGMTSAQIGALPNGSETGIKIYGSTGAKSEFANDITTLRDLLYWVAQTMGCFATINRAGQLVFRQYTQNVVDVISDTQRIEGATFADYITHYVGIYLENLDDNTEDYYGYTAAALTEELNETNAEIAADQERIGELDADLIEWKRKLDNHECTQQEYDEAVAAIDAELTPLKKEVKQLNKRVKWLTQAIAQAGNDGSDMVLGANPLLMDSNITKRDSERRTVLAALNDISYTPFNASVLCGCVYDLGDVIQFSGGLYNSVTDSFGCVMSYVYTHNGGTELEGFGVDPSVVVVRNKTQKSTDRANQNASTALNENDLVFDVDPDKNYEVVATNKGAYSTEGMTRKFKMWEYNFNFPQETAWAKYDVTLSMQYPYVLCTWPDLDHGNPRYCTINGKQYQSKCVAAVMKLQQDVGDNFQIKGQTWTRYAGNAQVGYNWFSELAFKRFATLYYYSGTGTGTMMYGLLDVEPDYAFNSLNDFFYAMDNGTIQIPGIAPDDECVLASEATAKQAAANVEYVVEKMKGNSPTRDTETYSGNLNVMSEKTMQRLSNAFYEMGDNVGSITNNVNDVKVDNVSVVTNKVANINTMTGATSEASGAKGLVPTPTTADTGKFLKGDGTWADAGTAITPNPQDTATADLTKVGIAGTVYNVKDAGAVRTTQVGVASGVAGLDSNGKVPSAQLPSYVDDVVEAYYDSDTDRFYEESTFTTVIPPVGDKLWVDIPANKSYRWTGSVYVRVDEGVQLGTTHSTAAYGDDAVSTAEPTFTEASTRANLLGTGEKLLVILGKIKKYFSDLKDLAFIAKDGTSSTKYLRGDGTWQAFPTIPTVNNGTLTIKQNSVSKGTFTANQSTAATIDLTDTTYSDATTSASGLMSSTDKTKLNNIANGAEVNVQSDWNVTDSGSDAFIKNKPTIPAAQVNSDWNASSGVAQILNKPTIPAAQIQSDWNQTTTTAKDYIKNKPTIPSVATKYDSSDAAETTLADDDKIPFYDTSASGRRNSTWANIKAKLKSYFDGIYSTFSGAYSDLTGKPTLGTAAAKDVPSSGNASSAQVVMGNDSRLTDSRNAADVYSWAKASTKPSYTANEVGAIPLTGSNVIRGDLTPAEDNDITLGELTLRYRDIFTVDAHVSEYLAIGKQGNYGYVDFLGSSGYSVSMLPTALTANRSLYLPNKGGTLAITDDIPTVQDNASATDLTDTSVPTGRTIESYLNSKMIKYVNSSAISITANAGGSALGAITLPSVLTGKTIIGAIILTDSVSGSWHFQVSYYDYAKNVIFYNRGTSSNTWTGRVCFLYV